jgi:hypothetical protein
MPYRSHADYRTAVPFGLDGDDLQIELLSNDVLEGGAGDDVSVWAGGGCG